MAGSTGVLPRAEGLSAAAARDLRQVRHPADLRRGHHRLRPARPRLRRRALRRHARHDHLRQGHHLGHRADGRRDRAQGRSTTPSCAGPSTWSSCSTATPIRRIRSPAPPASRRSTSIATRTCSRARKKLEPIWDDAAMSAQGPAATCSTSAASASPPASTSPRGPTRVGKRGYEAMERGFHDEDIIVPRRRRDDRADAAADREREPDRRDLRRRSATRHQGGGVKPIAATAPRSVRRANAGRGRRIAQPTVRT